MGLSLASNVAGVTAAKSVGFALLLDVGLRVARQHGGKRDDELDKDDEGEDGSRKADEADADSDDARHFWWWFPLLVFG